MAAETGQGRAYDFVIVGSGAGGGPLAANLALGGHEVLLVEAGGDETNDNYAVPAFHPYSTEDPLYSWEFYVDHYSEDPERDEKYHEAGSYPGAPGIFYPRASTLGGCTGHHAMITVYPGDSDWDRMAELLGDESWNAAHMRKLFERIERAQYQDGSILLRLLEPDETIPDLLARSRDLLRRLFGSEEGQAARGTRGRGWLTVTQADPLLVLRDRRVLEIVVGSFKTAKKHGIHPMPAFDPNHPEVAERKLEGFHLIPISVRNGRRAGSRERVRTAQKILRRLAGQGMEMGRLDVATSTFATEVVFADDDPTRAVGVRCVRGRDLYGARHHDLPAGTPGEEVVYRASKEVILAGGAFNTPQLLMLSGIGPRDELEGHCIPVRVASEGVGTNLQDRYEVGVVARVPEPFDLLADAGFRGRAKPTDPAPDGAFEEWLEGGGIYETNGALLGIIKRSSTRRAGDDPDLYIFGVPGLFRGYEIGYSEDVRDIKDNFTFAVLKGRTDNRSGRVTLRSKDPFDPPAIHFKYFEESDEPDEEDVQSVVDGVELVQEIFASLREKDVVAEQLRPEPGADLHRFVRDNAWGHHASCTCPIGPDGDPKAVLDQDFRVRGTKGLRVVDASVFPRIPGLFILASVYMVSEKASDVILAEYQ